MTDEVQLSPVGRYVQPMNLQYDLLDEADRPGGSGQVLTSLGPGLAPIWAAGNSGSGTTSFVHIQSVATTLWTINHNLGRILPVEVIDDSGREVEGLVTHLSGDLTTVEFVIPVAGRAIFG